MTDDAVRVHNLSAEAVSAMEIIDLATVTEPPPSPIGTFEFHGCTTGVASCAGRPPWELHTAGDELLYILSGECELTLLEAAGSVTRRLLTGDLVLIPHGCWHRNDAPSGVKMLFITPTVGNDHSWKDPRET